MYCMYKLPITEGQWVLARYCVYDLRVELEIQVLDWNISLRSADNIKSWLCYGTVVMTG